MANITLKSNPITTIGNLPVIGTKAPNFTLRNTDLSEVSLSDFEGQNLILNIFPSVDTGTCAMSVRTFNKQASELENTKVLCISRDLPFAHARFCGAEGIENVLSLSDISGKFGKDYEVTFANGPLEGLLSRSIVVINTQGEVTYTEQVSETTSEPNYEAALAAL
ncbi:thiol peroxidase [Wenyingzhuangia marina]|uniref:Thiol peroxidase n=1 Tax=Wenyingzhuangia marina TaxID=1195760 RepID=A0A1M5VDZ8_9FLAO|nr:thiol peroxidase [Wenyingzhuangia marina]GGF72685.1 putative thiol peroxidase [Wenyingzhuangia marina]SHH73460.1 thiol peroxidase (atypical 2-Cys peroxiredoxin) [Wenyingzhuangia marina]